MNIALKRWNGHWRQSKECAALSYSGLYFGHYKALTQSQDLSHVKIQLVNLAIKNRTPLNRWLSVISIMLEKKANDTSAS